MEMRYEPPRAYRETAETFIRNLVIAPNGTGDGINAPAPLSALATILRPGDKVWGLPGVYNFTQMLYLSVIANSKDRVIIQPLVPGSMIIDGSAVTPGTDYQIRITGDYIELNGIEIRRMPTKGLLVEGNHNTFRNVWTHHNSGTGIHIMNPQDNNVKTGQSYNLITDCVSDNNSDVNLPAQGENTDGLGISIGDENTIIRCLVHTNSDDGIDVWQSNRTLIHSCFSHSNGYGPNGDGNGYKLGNPNARGNRIWNSIASSNRTRGFDGNGSPDVSLESCAAIKQVTPFKLIAGNSAIGCTTDGVPLTGY